MSGKVNLLFSDYFLIDKKVLDEFGAFDISLVSDLPLFIDPFLLFNSDKQEYQKLHEGMINYLKFLRDKSIENKLTPGLLAAWYRFKEVKQNWLGFAVEGNSGSALGKDFAEALNDSFHRIFTNYGQEQITKGTHLEKLALIKDGIGKDNISDFTTNLIKEFLLEYTQEFAKKHIKPEKCKKFRILRVKFNYETETWEEKTYYLPENNEDFVILTPKDLLTRDETWINGSDMIKGFQDIPYAISNQELRDQINNYFSKVLPDNPTKKEEHEAARKTILEFPEIIDYYIKRKEDKGDQAESISAQKVDYSENLYLEQFKSLAMLVAEKTPFYQTPKDSYAEALKRVHYIKDVVEKNDGYRYFYDKNDQAVRREEDLKIAYRLTWFGTPFDFNTEVNNGRGPADSKISMGSTNITLVEFKLASNTKLKKNLQNQVEIYKAANNTTKSIKVIIYFSADELKSVQEILRDLNLVDKEDVVLIDARNDNKPSASNA